jgi:type 1 glutamine amidotransferase
MRNPIFSLSVGTALLLSSSFASAQVTEDKLAKITAAVSKQKAVASDKKRHLLVFSFTNGFRHGSIPVGAKSMTLLGQTTGAFEVTHTEDFSIFEPDSLARFDAVLMLNTTGKIFRPSKKNLTNLSATELAEVDATEIRLKKSLADFVRGGKGLAGFHSATDTYKNWDIYNQMMGGAFAGHPWGSRSVVGVRIDDPHNRLTKVFGAQSFEIQDEIYQFRNDTCHRDHQRILLSLDPELTDLKRGQRDNGDYPISWVRDFGKGRVFYSSLGHNDAIFWNEKILTFYLAGLQFALGDLDGVETNPVPLSQK